MRKVIAFSILALFLFSFAFVLADSDNGNGVQNQASISVASNSGTSATATNTETRERIRERLEAGENLTIGEKLRVRKTIENRMMLKSNEIEAKTELELEEDGTRLHAVLSNGRKAEVKIMPDTASETALARLRLKVCNESNNCTLQLKEMKQNRNQNESRLAYEVQAERHYRILGLFKAKAQNRVQVDAENGEVISENGPWWSFLAGKVDETAE